jgi:hypothetical protein
VFSSEPAGDTSSGDEFSVEFKGFHHEVVHEHHEDSHLFRVGRLRGFKKDDGRLVNKVREGVVHVWITIYPRFKESVDGVHYQVRGSKELEC